MDIPNQYYEVMNKREKSSLASIVFHLLRNWSLRFKKGG